MNSRRILVVDDERIVAQDIMEVLANMGCEVVGTALSGEEAIEKAGQLRPDLILMDITLQGEMDGVEAATIIRRNLDIPSVFLTAYSDKSYLERAKLTQPAGYMVKPFEEAGLRSTVEIALYKVDLERALKESNEWLQTTLMSISDGVIATNAEGHVRFMNPLAEALTGWSSDQASGRWIEEVFPIANEFTGEQAINPALAALRQARVTTAEHGVILTRRDGSLLPIDESGAPICNPRGETVGAVLVFRDMTEKRATEREMRRYQGHLEELVQERTAEILQTNERLRGEIEERKRAEQALEYRANMEMLLASVSSTFLRAKPTEVDQAIESSLSAIGSFLMADRCYLLQPTGNSLISCTHEWTMHGVEPMRERFTQIPSSSLPVTPSGMPSGALLVISQSGGERIPSLQPQIAQARAARSVLLVQMMGSDAPPCFLGVDCVRESRQWHQEDATTLNLAADPLLSALRRKRIEEDKARLQGQLNHSQKMEAVGKLSSGIAHDFNNMLLPIIGYADMVLDRLPTDDPSVFELTEIRRAAEQAAGLTKQLLAFSRKQVVKKSIFDVNQALQHMNRMLQRIIGEDVRIQMDLAPDLLAVEADAGQLEQIVMNLCVNARDAMPGVGLIRIRTRNVPAGSEAVPLLAGQAAPGDFICLEVTDNGHGIPPEVREHIFEPFFTTKGTSGTGLGLSVIYGIVQEHSGGLSVESEVGRGSTFRVFLPALRVRLPIPVPDSVVESSKPSGTFRGRGEKVLLVEDEEAVNRLVRTALTQNGYLVTEAHSVSDAMTKFQQGSGRFDMVFSDAVLPDGNGVDLISIFRRQNPSLRVLLSSGYTDRSHLMEMAKQQQISFLPKPYSLPRLFQTVAEVMQDQRNHVLV